MNLYKNKAYLYSAIVAMGSFVFGLDAALISGTIDFISRDFTLSTFQLGVIVGAPALGVILALLFVGFSCNMFGRKRTLQIVASLYIISALGSSFAIDYWSLLVFRFIGGWAFTSISLASMYIGEIAPPNYRGKLVTIIQINIVIGLFGAYFINYLILKWGVSGTQSASVLGVDTYPWRWMLGAEVIPAVLWMVLLTIVPCSPTWLVSKGKNKEAMKTLLKLMPIKDAEMSFEGLKKSVLNSKKESFILQFKNIFSKKYKVIFIIAITLAIAQQTSGINAILFYAPSIFEQIGVGKDTAFIQAIWTGLTALIFTVLGLICIDRLGRKPMIIGGMLWVVLSLGITYYGFKTATYTVTKKAVSEVTQITNTETLNDIIGVEFSNDIELKSSLIKLLGEHEASKASNELVKKSVKINSFLILIGILSFIAAFHFSLGPIMWVLFSEIFPNSIRTIAIPFFTFVSSLISWLVQTFFPVQLDNFGISNTILFYTIAVFIGMLILSKYLIETKGLSIEDIQLKLQKK